MAKTFLDYKRRDRKALEEVVVLAKLLVNALIFRY